PHVIPYLVVEGADEAIEFYKAVLGATERMRMPGPGGRIGHAELEVGESLVLLASEVPDIGLRSPRGFGGTPVAIYVYVEDVDASFTRALAAGSKALRPVEDRFYGDRAG